jgi:hypothetical protein
MLRYLCSLLFKTAELSRSMPPVHPTAKTSITDSPWYWVYLFGTAGLVALLLAGHKYAARQSQVERAGQGRQRAVKNLQGQAPTTEMSSEDHTQVSLRPLYYVLAAILILAWAGLIRRHLKRTRDFQHVTVAGTSGESVPR